MAVAELGLDVKIGANIDVLRTVLKDVGTDIGGVQKAITASIANINNLAKQYPGYFENALNYAKKLEKFTDKVANQKTPVRQSQIAEIRGGIDSYSKQLKAAPNEYNKKELAERKAIEAQIKRQEKAILDVEKALIREAKAAETADAKRFSGLVRARYALYDVANEGRRVGIIMTGLGLGAAKLGGDFEKAFKNVERTTGATGSELENLKASLIDVSQVTPISFADITAIATLGAQMGIVSGSVDDFASTVAKFAAVTGVSVDTAATSLGRVSQLLGLSADGYEKLASSIVYAGRNSIATEAQILALTTQISSSTQQAGFLADETVGLATALSSLGIAPEQARGVILRLFADFDKAVSENGKTLRDYGALLGMTSTEVASLYKTDPSKFFLSFTEALSKTGQSAQGVNGILSALGIVETREINVLQRLAGNQALVLQSMRDAGIGYSDASDLSDQFGIRTENLIDKLTRLANNILSLGAAIGESFGFFLKPLVDFLSGIIGSIADNKIATTIAAIGLAVAAGVGVFLLYKAAIAQAMASLFAISTSMKSLEAISANTTLTMKGLVFTTKELGLGFGALGAGANKASLSLTGLRASASSMLSSVRGILPIMVAVAAGITLTGIEAERSKVRIKEMADAMNEAGDAGEALNTVKFFDSAKSEIVNLGDFTSGLSDFQKQLQATQSISNQISGSVFSLIGLNDLTTLGMAKKDIAAVDSALAKMVSDGKVAEAGSQFHDLGLQAMNAGMSQEKLIELMPEYSNAINGTIPALNDLSDSQLDASASGENLSDIIRTRLIESMIGAEKQNASFVSSIVGFSESLVDSKGSISSWSATGRKALGSFEDLINKIADVSGNDMAGAIQITAAAIGQIELAGGNASSQVRGLVDRINSLYGLNLNGSTVTSIAQLQALIASTGSIASGTKLEIASLLSGGGFAGVMKQAFDQAKKSVNGAGSAVKKQIRTLKDYASDISGLFSDIYDNAYSLTSANDSFESSWESIKNRVEDAKSSIEDLKLELEGMNANKDVLTYQLGVAVKYGDTLRANKIRADIAKLEKDITKKTADRTKAEEESTMSLEGNTKAARDNRDEVRAQVKDAGELIAAYAATVQANGKLPSKSAVTAYAISVAENFRKQGTDVGFAAAELESYAKIISGFGSAAKVVELPNVKVKLDPVKSAIEAYLAEKKESKVSMSPGTSTSALDAFYKTIQDYFASKKVTIDFKAGTLPGTIPSTAVNSVGPLKSGYATTPTATPALRNTLASYEKSLAASRTLLANANKNKSSSGAISASAAVSYWDKKIKDLKAKYTFASGGYVSGPGTSTSDSISAQLSNGEYVIQSSAVNRYGVDFMNALNQMRVGSPSPQRPAAMAASSGPSVVYLSPEDRSLLRAAVDRPIALYTENTKIAQSANAGNVVLAQRGSN